MKTALAKICWRVVRIFLGRRRREFDARYHTARAKEHLGSYGARLQVNAHCRFNRRCRLGTNCNFNGMTVLGSGTLDIGDNFHSGQNCRIITSNHNFDQGEAIPYDDTNVDKHIVIGNNVWLGDSVIIVGNVTIGEGAIVGAGAVVSKDVPACAIVAGNPASVVKYRDRAHYDKLKAEGKFH